MFAVTEIFSSWAQIFWEHISSFESFCRVNLFTILGTLIVGVVVIKMVSYLGYGMRFSLRLRSPYENSMSLVPPPTHSQPHRFYQQDVGLLNRPVYCNICAKIMIEEALCCGICGYSTHKACLKRRQDNCKYIFFDAEYFSREANTKKSRMPAAHQPTAKADRDSTPIRVPMKEGWSTPTDASAATAHQWMKGNQSVSDLCYVCGVTCGSLFELGGLECLWCRAKVHTSCLDFMPSPCSLGSVRDLVLPPTCVRPAPSRTDKSLRRRMGSFTHRLASEAKRALQRRSRGETPSKPGSNSHTPLLPEPLWSITLPPSIARSTIAPLVVFLNPKSGGRWGDKLMRQFMALLNPLQVFDLSQGGPRPGLLQFAHVPVRFPISICAAACVACVPFVFDFISSSSPQRFRVLACGGDGTIAWVLSAVHGSDPISLLTLTTLSGRRDFWLETRGRYTAKYFCALFCFCPHTRAHTPPLHTVLVLTKCLTPCHVQALTLDAPSP
jgi:hypothetical protein